MRKKTSIIFLFICVLLTSCGMNSGSSQSSQVNYKDMKSMVLDILKTEDAQKAFQESLNQSSGLSIQGVSLLSAQDQEQVKIAVKDVISSPEYDKVIKSLMTDTKFAGEFSKAVNESNKELHEQLVKDPQYQAGLVEAFQTDEMKKLFMDTLKTAEYRKELMSLMQESLKNPIFRMELLKLMQEAVSSELSSSGGGKEGGGNTSSGGGDSGEGEESGGGKDSKGGKTGKSSSGGS